MNQELFPNLIPRVDFIFKVYYEGDSFDGKINLHNLAEELTGFEYCLRTITSLAYKRNILDINPVEYEFVVEPFEKGSFRKVIKLIPKNLEKYPSTTSAALTVALIFVGIGQIIVANNTNNSTQPISQSSIDKIKLELLTDKDFLRSYSKVVDPLTNKTDKLRLIKPDNTEYEINYAQKDNFDNLANDDYEFITEHEETLIGRVTRVDLTATKNALGFKVNDSGVTIPCSFLDSINVDERKELLDQWIEISGITEKSEKERRHIKIFHYKVVNQPKQTELPMLEF